MNLPDQAVPIDRKTAGISGFWRRVFAFLVDTIILSLPAFVLGLIFFDQFTSLGPWGRLVGFCIAFLYFGSMNSSFANGQTVGKHLARIRVVDQYDEPIVFSRSCGRYAILGLPYFLNGALIPPHVLSGWLGLVIGVVVFGMGLSICYLLIFNRRNRRSLHDLICGTYVVKRERDPALPKPQTWFGHYVVVGFLLVASIVAPVIAVRYIAAQGIFKDLVSLQKSILEQPWVQSASVNVGKNVFWNANGRVFTTALQVRIGVSRHIDNYDELLDQSADLVLRNYPRGTELDRIVISLSRGYDLGIASWHIDRGASYSPDEWRQRINTRSTTKT